MKKEDVVAGMLAYIAHLREVGRYSTAKSYLDALRSVSYTHLTLPTNSLV